MKFKAIFDVFSMRKEQTDPFVYSVPVTIRNKVLLFCRDVFSNQHRPYRGDDYTHEFWREIHQMLQYRHGRLQLTRDSSSPIDDGINFLVSCKDEEFLDFVEYIFRVKCLGRVSDDDNQLVAAMNQLFASENVGYELTDMVKEEIEEVREPVEFGPVYRRGKVIKTIAYPRIIKKDNQVIHALAVKPALELVSDPKYKTANQEYLEALEDYKKGDYGDCLTKCGSAFESVMKIICDQKRWSYKQTDTASTLISIIIKNGGLDSYFDQPLMIIATLRNRLSKSHGAGTHPKRVTQNLARYTLNSTASAIIFLINETK